MNERLDGFKDTVSNAWTGVKEKYVVYSTASHNKLDNICENYMPQKMQNVLKNQFVRIAILMILCYLLYLCCFGFGKSYASERTELRFKISELENQVKELESLRDAYKSHSEYYKEQIKGVADTSRKCRRQVNNLKAHVDIAKNQKSYWGNVRTEHFEEVVDQTEEAYRVCKQLEGY